MSTRMMDMVWPLRLDPSSKAVLVSLADQANDAGVCWPSVGSIAERTCLAERTVQAAVKRLEDMGLLEVRVQGAPRWGDKRLLSNLYLLKIREFVAHQQAQEEAKNAPTPAAAAPPQQLHPRSSCTVTPAAAAPKPSVEPIQLHTPIPPAGQGAEATPAKLAALAKPGRKATRPGVLKLADWLALCAQEGVKPIPPDDPVWDYAASVGLSAELVRMAWVAFKRGRLASGKAQRDWRATFRNAVRGNWGRLWFIPPGGEPQLSTVGEQLRRELDAEQAAEGAAA
ncbi:MAG: helix-turn-helix domain-containing protein [Inhella sp.]